VEHTGIVPKWAVVDKLTTKGSKNVWKKSIAVAANVQKIMGKLKIIKFKKYLKLSRRAFFAKGKMPNQRASKVS